MPEDNANTNPDSSVRHRHPADLEIAKTSIERLLAYAVANPDIPIEENLLKQTITILRKPSQEFTEEDEFHLWDSQSQLAKLVKPATDLSLQIAQQLNETESKPEPDTPAVSRCRWDMRKLVFFLVLAVITYVLIQGQCALLSAALTSSGKVLAQWESQQQLISTAKPLGDESSPATDQVRANLSGMAHELSASSQALLDLTRPLVKINELARGHGIFISGATATILRNCEQRNLLVQEVFNTRSLKDSIRLVLGNNLPTPAGTIPVPGTPNAAAADEPVPVNLLACVTFEREYAASLYAVLSRYILPLILGVIGAMAYVARRTLSRLETNSYLPAASGRLLIRLCLGAMLGAISGIFLSVDQKEIQGFNLSLTMVALSMGYSVEVAFSLFDSAIQRIRDWAESLRRPPEAEPDKK